jgi:hypothetical protein
MDNVPYEGLELVTGQTFETDTVQTIDVSGKHFYECTFKGETSFVNSDERRGAVSNCAFISTSPPPLNWSPAEDFLRARMPELFPRTLPHELN